MAGMARAPRVRRRALLAPARSVPAKGVGAALVGALALAVLAPSAPVRAADPPSAPQAPTAAVPAGHAAPLPVVVLGQRGQVVPPVIEDVEQMCALLTSCDGLPIPPNLVPTDFATCVRQLAADMTSASAVSLSLMLRECGLKANSCNELKACALRGAKPDSCVGRGKQTMAGFCDIA